MLSPPEFPSWRGPQALSPRWRGVKGICIKLRILFLKKRGIPLEKEQCVSMFFPLIPPNPLLKSLSLPTSLEHYEEMFRRGCPSRNFYAL